MAPPSIVFHYLFRNSTPSRSSNSYIEGWPAVKCLRKPEIWVTLKALRIFSLEKSHRCTWRLPLNVENASLWPVGQQAQNKEEDVSVMQLCLGSMVQWLCPLISRTRHGEGRLYVFKNNLGHYVRELGFLMIITIWE